MRPMRSPPGMIGGPTGFDGAERYQYGADTPEGRAIEAAKAMKGRQASTRSCSAFRTARSAS